MRRRLGRTLTMPLQDARERHPILYTDLLETYCNKVNQASSTLAVLPQRNTGIPNARREDKGSINGLKDDGEIWKRHCPSSWIKLNMDLKKAGAAWLGKIKP